MPWGKRGTDTSTWVVLAVGLAISARSAAADSGIRSEIAVHVYNYARVDQQTLAEAEKVAARIFEKAGSRNPMG